MGAGVGVDVFVSDGGEVVVGTDDVAGETAMVFVISPAFTSIVPVFWRSTWKSTVVALFPPSSIVFV